MALVCGHGVTHSETAVGYGSSLLMGRVLDAETEEPVAGVHVSLVWWQIQAGRVLHLLAQALLAVLLGKRSKLLALGT